MKSSKNWRRLFLLVLLLVAISCSGCSSFNHSADQEKAGSITLSSSLNVKILTKLLAAYNNSQKVYVVQLVKNEGQTPDLFLEPNGVLKAKADSLQLWPKGTGYEGVLPFKDAEDHWLGVFYDPVVFLVNREFSRRVGQKKIQSWSDLPKLDQARLTMENLNGNFLAEDFLASMSSKMGEHEFFSYLKQLQPSIKRYGKFPITVIRWVAGGEADVAPVRLSSAVQYLEPDFPAYVQFPQGGTPIALYALACSKGNPQIKAGQNFYAWLQTPEARNIYEPAGYLPLHATDGTFPVKAEDLWLNIYYQDQQRQAMLTDTWVKTIRLSPEAEVK